jgi:hypothetical protein
MLGRTFCPLGDAAAMPIISYIQEVPQEFEDHLDGKPCPYEKAAGRWPVANQWPVLKPVGTTGFSPEG